MVVWYASQPHYAAHLDPIRHEAAPKAQGRALGTPRALWGERGTPARTEPVVVASGVDSQRWRHHPVVYVEHGAGQSYDGDVEQRANPAYSGGAGHDHVVLFVCPNQAVADRWAAAYPDTPTVVVGCPRLDQHHPRNGRIDGPRRIAFTFHWDCKMLPETRSAWRHWRTAVLEYCRDQSRTEVIAGHAHPRAPEIRASLASFGLPIIDDVDDMLRWADLIVADNTSVLYEACALGIPTLVLNAPWYRRGVNHGLRFWDFPPGPTIDQPGELVAAVHDQLEHPDRHAVPRERAAFAAYGGLVDGRASRRAATAIEAVV